MYTMVSLLGQYDKFIRLFYHRGMESTIKSFQEKFYDFIDYNPPTAHFLIFQIVPTADSLYYAL